MKYLLLALAFTVALTTTGQPPCATQICPNYACWGSDDCWDCVCVVARGSVGPGICLPSIDY